MMKCKSSSDDVTAANPIMILPTESPIIQSFKQWEENERKQGWEQNRFKITIILLLLIVQERRSLSEHTL